MRGGREEEKIGWLEHYRVGFRKSKRGVIDIYSVVQTIISWGMVSEFEKSYQTIKTYWYSTVK